MYKIKSYKPDSHKAIAQAAIAGKFKDNIWTIIDSWIHDLSTKKGNYCWHRIAREQLTDSMPDLLSGIARTIEYPHNLLEFEPGGLLHKTATEFGTKRRLLNYESSELLLEQETIRNVIWSFCRKSLKALDVYELEGRVGKSLDKATFTIIESYIGEFADELRYLAYHDKTTGFLNYDSYKKTLDTEIKRAKRYRHKCSLIFVEIDNISKRRGLYGSINAENPILELSTIIDQFVRSIDICARYNLNTFALILPETSLSQARKVAERLRRAIKQESRHNHKDTTTKQPIAINVGVSEFAYKNNINTSDELEKATKKALARSRLNSNMFAFK